MSIAAAWTLGDQAKGSTVLRIFQPLTSSNLRMNEFDALRQISMIRRIDVAMTGEGLSPSSSRHILATGSAEANLVNSPEVCRTDTNIWRTCSALSRASVRTCLETVEFGDSAGGVPARYENAHIMLKTPCTYRHAGSQLGMLQ